MLREIAREGMKIGRRGGVRQGRARRQVEGFGGLVAAGAFGGEEQAGGVLWWAANLVCTALAKAVASASVISPSWLVSAWAAASLKMMLEDFLWFQVTNDCPIQMVNVTWAGLPQGKVGGGG